MTFEESFIQDAIKRLSTYKDLGDKTLAVLSEDDIHFAQTKRATALRPSFNIYMAI